MWESDDHDWVIVECIGPSEGNPPSHFHYELCMKNDTVIGTPVKTFTESEMDRLSLALMKPRDEDVSLPEGGVE